MRKTLRTWFQRTAHGELPDLPARPQLTASSGEDRLWHTVAQDVYHLLQRPLATLTWDDSEVLKRKHPDPSWRPECEKAIQSIRQLCALIVEDPNAARSALPFLVQALQAGDALVQVEAALGVGDNEFRHEAFLRNRQSALKRAESVRDTVHQEIIAAMREQYEANATKKRPLSFTSAARIVARTVKHPKTDQSYSERWIREISKANGIYW